MGFNGQNSGDDRAQNTLTSESLDTRQKVMHSRWNSADAFRPWVPFSELRKGWEIAVYWALPGEPVL